jgi:glycosyltransferase involved in cell wall biosynthesis
MPHAFSLPSQDYGRDAARQMCSIAMGERLVFCVGRLEIFKGHDVLLDAWVDVVRNHPEKRLVIAGSGSCLENLQQQAATLGIEKSVLFIGHLSAPEVHQWMAAADLFVLPSRSEPFGIVLLEAMAHGLPVVASNVGGIPEVVPTGRDVRLVAPNNINELSVAMQEMGERDFSFSQSNRLHAMQFAWDLQVERFESVYVSLLS